MTEVDSDPVTTSPAARATTRRNVRGSSLLTAGRLIAVGINFVIHVLIVRYFSQTQYGALAFALSAVSLGSSVAVMGMNRTLARFVPIYEEQGDTNRVFGAMAVGLGLIAGVALAIVLGFYVAGAVMGESLIHDDLARSVLFILILLVPLQAFDSAMLGLFAIFDSPRNILWRRHIFAPLALLVVTLLAVGMRLDVQTYAMATVVVPALGLAIYSVMLLRVVRRRGLLERFRPSSMRYPVRELLGFSLPLLSTDVVYVLRRSAIVLILGSMAGLSEVALFSAAVPIANQNMLVLDSFRLLFTPAASRLYARHDGPAINDLYWQTAVWVVIATLPFLLVSFSLAEPVTTFLFGEAYAQSAIVLAILGAGFYLNSAFGHNSLILRVYGRVRFLVTVDVATAVVGVALAIPLIGLMGAVGAAIAATLIIVLQNILYQIGLQRSTSVSGFDVHYLPVYLGVPVAVGIVLVVQVTLEPPLWAGIAIAALVWLAYVAVMRRYLRLADTFPELRRLPLARLIMD